MVYYMSFFIVDPNITNEISVLIWLLDINNARYL